jgi:hypothetical protein
MDRLPLRTKNRRSRMIWFHVSRWLLIRSNRSAMNVYMVESGGTACLCTVDHHPSRCRPMWQGSLPVQTTVAWILSAGCLVQMICQRLRLHTIGPASWRGHDPLLHCFQIPATVSIPSQVEIVHSELTSLLNPLPSHPVISVIFPTRAHSPILE